MAYTFIDLGSVFWPSWFATLSGTRAYDYTIEQLLWYRDNCTGVVVCCDHPQLMRKDWCEDYKAQREEKPKEAVCALTSVESQVDRWGLPRIKCLGYEADDIVATLVAQAWESVLIVGQDKDLYALLSNSVKMQTKRAIIGPDGCVEKFGVQPEQMRDYIAIVGDTADNIEGCPGFGPGKARDVLNAFETLEEAKRVAKESPPDFLKVHGIGKTLMFNFQEWDPELAVKLATLMTDAPVELTTLWEPQDEYGAAEVPW